MTDFVLTTHTRWDEAPRIRHQVARLLRDAGHRVLFVERGERAWGGRASLPTEAEPGIWIARPTRLVHHQLRVLPPQHRLEAWHAARGLRALLAPWNPRPGFGIVNFMHDGWFLRAAFPGTRITTIIHDDFEAQSRLPFQGHITWTLERTCRASDAVLAVSEPLRARLSRWCNAQLFLPWAVVPYRAPAEGTARDTLLFWGFVDNALDLDMVRALSGHLLRTRPAWKLLFVGPTQTAGARERIAAEFAALPNLELRGPTALDELPLDRIAGAILPYRRSPAIDTVTLANKSMQLLARGLPLLISAMPAFVREPFVIRLDGAEGLEHALGRCTSEFTGLQPEIRRFCLENSPESRLRQLLGEPS